MNEQNLDEHAINDSLTTIVEELKNQFGKQNMSPKELSYFRGQCYLLIKEKYGHESGWLIKLASHFGVSEKTIKRDALFAEKLNTQPELKDQILSGELKTTKSFILQKNENKLVKQSEIPISVSAEKIASIALSYLVNEHRSLNDVFNEISKHDPEANLKDDNYPLHFFLTWYKLVTQ